MKKTVHIIGVDQKGRPVTSIDRIPSTPICFSKVSIPEILVESELSVKSVAPSLNEVDGLADPYQQLAAALIANAPTVLLTAGNPLVDEAALPAIREQALAADVTVTIHAAPTRLTTYLETLQISATAGLQILDATLLASYHFPPLEAHRPALITGLYHPGLLPGLLSRLGKLYPPTVAAHGIDHRGAMVSGPLPDIAPQCEAIYLPPQATKRGLTAFQETIAHLRAPNGCPWDQAQSHQSLRPYLLEETYEALSALDANDMPALAEELGDVLLQIALHTQIAHEHGDFQMADVIDHIDRKMLRRHPHVFGSVSANTADEVRVNWEAIKAQEKAENGTDDQLNSVLDGVNPAMPALAQTLIISQRAVDAGFEWRTMDGVLQKLVEEAHEIATAPTRENLESEIGDFLFTAVNLARKLKIDPESTLRATNARFTTRFQTMEKLAQQRNLTLTDLTIDQWQGLWRKAKQLTANKGQ